ncbi:cytochrome c mitochondrial import factor (Cyc2) [Histoplasma ohiense]|nr:cytochrome c mitochondrial import factor (Cyc2) [Histoplasma ohiense (nom. inval.)]
MHILWANRRRDDCLGGVSDSSSRRPTTGSSSWWEWVFRTSTGPPEKRQIQRNDIEKNLTVQYLEELKAQYPGLLTVDYFVDEEGTLIGKDAILGFTEPERATRSPGGGTKLILISGPDGFISYLAGPKMWSGGKEIQGPLQGLICQLDLKDWSVQKL